MASHYGMPMDFHGLPTEIPRKQWNRRGLPWNSISFPGHGGFPRIPMDFHKLQLISMGSHASPLNHMEIKASLDFNVFPWLGFPWIANDFHRFRRKSIEIDGFRRSVDIRGFRWISMDFDGANGSPWISMDFNGLQRMSWNV